MKRPPHRLRIERLDDRVVPTLFGVPWADPSHLTLSFVPDGTTVPGGTSQLSAVLNADDPTGAWQREILRAFQSWAVNANINVGLVADGGQPLGTPGAVQGDARFGDVRVATSTQDPDTLASAAPFNWTGSTFGGDVLLNPTTPFAVGNVAGKDDLFSIAVHEAGHSLGLAHTTAAGAVMNPNYFYRPGLTAADVSALQALYGARTPDPYDAAKSNDTLASATQLNAVSGNPNQVVAQGDLTTATDVDYYKVSVPGVTALMTVRLKDAGYSLLTGAVTVYNALGVPVGSAVTTDPTNNDLTVSVLAPVAGNYFIKVAGATNDVFSVGGYQLAVDYLSTKTAKPPALPKTPPVADGHTNDTINAATQINPKTQTDARFDAVYAGAIEDGTDTDFYQIQAPSGTGAVNLNVLVWSTDALGLTPRVRLYDAGKNPVAFQVLSNSAGLMSVEVPNLAAGKAYYVQVSAQTPGTGPGSTGGYFLGADFNQAVLSTLDGVSTAPLPAGATAAGTFATPTGGIYQFALGATGTGSVSMTVQDATGATVFTFTATAGQPAVTQTAPLAAGAYTIQYQSLASSGSLQYSLFSAELSANIGPMTTNTSTTGSSPPPPPSYTYSGGGGAQSSGAAYTY